MDPSNCLDWALTSVSVGPFRLLVELLAPSQPPLYSLTTDVSLDISIP